MTFRDLLSILWRHRWVAVGAFALCLAAGLAAALIPQNRYEATATLIIQPSDVSADPFGSVEVARFLQPAVAEVVETRSFRARVRDSLSSGTTGKPADLVAVPEPGTPIIRVFAEASDPAVAAAWANAAAGELTAASPSPLVEIAVIDPARPSPRPSGPLRVPILLGATVLGLIAGIFSALATDTIRRRLSGPEEIRERFDIEVLGEIPVVRRFPSGPAEIHGVHGDPHVIEAYQHLRTNFEFAVLAKQVRAVAITSIELGEGKTSVTSNLAWVMASLGEEVVAVDGDLRRPALHRALNLDVRPGVADVVQGANVEHLQQPTAMSGLSVIPAGETERHPAEVVARSFPRLLSALEASRKFAVIDTPPLIVTEAALLAGMTGAVLLVVDASRRDPDEIKRALAELEQAGADVLGIVVNRSRRRPSRRGSEYYYSHLADHPRRRWTPGTREAATQPPDNETSGPPTTDRRGQ